MSALAPSTGIAPSAAVRRQARARAVGARHAVPILQVFALSLFIIPSDIVLKPLSAIGYPAGIVGMLAFAVWCIATLLGLHDPRLHRHPIRGVLCLLWMASLISYLQIDRGMDTVLQTQSADRYIMQLAVMSGAALIAAECLSSLRDIHRVLRALTWGAAFCGFVAGLQFWFSFDITSYLRIPGFIVNSDTSALASRGGLNRVLGTSIHPIELGVTAGMLLPIAIYLAIYDKDRGPKSRCVPLLLITVSIMGSVSRSALLALAIGMAFLIVTMPVHQRLVTLSAVPLGLAAVFVSAHGLLATIASFIGYGANDPSILHRTNNYPYVEALVRQAPLFGHGGGTFLPNSLHVLDDEFLSTAVTLGLVGVVVLAMLFLYPTLAALRARRHTVDEQLRLLLAVLAGATCAAGVCSTAFDSMSFPMFYNTFALVLGLIGACWQIAMRGETPAQEPQRAAHGLLPHGILRHGLLPHGLLPHGLSPGLQQTGSNYALASTEGA
jgi:O-antigen ligase